MELNKLKLVLDWHSKLEEEITSIARNHKDYEILKSFHTSGEKLRKFGKIF
jgi:hypothetical protein